MQGKRGVIIVSLSHEVTEHRHNAQNKHKNTKRPNNNVIHIVNFSFIFGELCTGRFQKISFEAECVL